MTTVDPFNEPSLYAVWRGSGFDSYPATLVDRLSHVQYTCDVAWDVCLELGGVSGMERAPGNPLCNWCSFGYKMRARCRTMPAGGGRTNEWNRLREGISILVSINS
jgi:hypothetical protein